MTSTQRHSQASRFGRTIAPLGVAALAATVGCGAPVQGNSTPAQPVAAAAAQPAGTPVVVSCEPNQRTLVRPVVVNGATVSQVECVSNVAAPISALATQAPVFAQPVAQPVAYRPVAVRSEDLGDTQVIATERPVTTTRAIPARQVVYRDELPVRKKRSVAKSAVIIGSTAGAGAGVGALIGGKKGALIGAAVGGGGATLWDQITRRKP
jgi:hypothetical protein